MSNLEDKVEKARALAEATVAALSEEPEQAAPGSMKRLTFDVSKDLHRRIKTGCAIRGEMMADVIREILEREFPK